MRHLVSHELRMEQLTTPLQLNALVQAMMQPAPPPPTPHPYDTHTHTSPPTPAPMRCLRTLYLSTVSYTLYSSHLLSTDARTRTRAHTQTHKHGGS